MPMLPLFHAIFNRRMLAVLILGFASGLPLALTGQSLQAWLTVSGVDITTIGMFALVGQPYAYKFLWAPLMDRFEPPFFGRRRGWLVLSQITLTLLLGGMSVLQPNLQASTLALVATLVAFFSASQDVVVDAYRTEVSKAETGGMAAALSVFGYRVAMLVSGGLAFLLADQLLGWAGTYRVMACLMALTALYSCWAPSLDSPDGQSKSRESFWSFAFLVVVGLLTIAAVAFLLIEALPERLWTGVVYISVAGLVGVYVVKQIGRAIRFDSVDELVGFAWMLIAVLLGYGAARGGLFLLGFSPSAKGNEWVDLGFIMAELAIAIPSAIVAARLSRFRLLLDPLQAYFTRHYAWGFLIIVVAYKLSDAFAGALITKFLIDGAHFSLTEVGVANKVFGLLATIVGAMLGGVLMIRLRLWTSLFVFGVIQTIATCGYWWLSVAGKGAWGAWDLSLDWMRVFFGAKPLHDVAASLDVLLMFSVFVENLTSGMGTAALVAFLMALCSDKKATATQFALLSALSAIGRVYVGPSSGFLVGALGWNYYFIFSMAAGVPVLVLLWVLRKPIELVGVKDGA